METINYTEEEEEFMREKSLAIMNKTKNLNLSLDDVDIKLQRLEGISNKIYNVQIKTNSKKEQEQEFDLFFKIFGKISSNINKNNKKFIKIYSNC